MAIVKDDILIDRSSTGAIDRDLLGRLSEGDIEFERELLETYLEDAQICLEQLEIAFAGSNWQAVIEIAHQLKGASGNVGAAGMAELAAQLERQAQQQEGRDLLQHLQRTLLAIEQIVADW